MVPKTLCSLRFSLCAQQKKLLLWKLLMLVRWSKHPTPSANDALPAEEGITTRTGNPTEETLTDVAGGMTDTANSKKPLVPYEDSDEDKAEQDK